METVKLCNSKGISYCVVLVHTFEMHSRRKVETISKKKEEEEEERERNASLSFFKEHRRPASFEN